MSERSKDFLAEQMKDPEFAEAYQRVSAEVDREFHALKSRVSEIADLEVAVIEAAVKLAKTSNHIDDMGEWETNEAELLAHTDALIAAREKVEIDKTGE